MFSGIPTIRELAEKTESQMVRVLGINSPTCLCTAAASPFDYNAILTRGKRNMEELGLIKGVASDKVLSAFSERGEPTGGGSGLRCRYQSFSALLILLAQHDDLQWVVVKRKLIQRRDTWAKNFYSQVC